MSSDKKDLIFLFLSVASQLNYLGLVFLAVCEAEFHLICQALEREEKAFSFQPSPFISGFYTMYNVNLSFLKAKA